MRVLIAAALTMLLSAAQAQPFWHERVEAIAALPLPERSAAAQRQAQEWIGPRPTGANAARAYDQAVERQRQLMLEGAASMDRRRAEEFRRVQLQEAASADRQRALELCRLSAPTGARQWDYIHACYGQRR